MRVEIKIKNRLSELDQFLNEISIKVKSGESFDILFQQWGTSFLNILENAFPNDSPHLRSFKTQYDWHLLGTANFSFQKCKGIFYAAKEDYENEHLANLRTLLKAEFLTEDIISQTKELLNNGYKDPACILAGVALETSLKELCSNNGIPASSLNNMNNALRIAGIYNLAKNKQITAWADLRNKAAHGDWNQYSEKDVTDLINGVQRFIGEYL